MACICRSSYFESALCLGTCIRKRLNCSHTVGDWDAPAHGIDAASIYPVKRPT